MPEDRDLHRLPHLDRLIDEALGTYADSSLDENLAGRVLVQLANEHALEPRHRWWPWAAVAVPAVICLLLLIHFGDEITRPHVAPPLQSARLHTPAGVAVGSQPHAAPAAETRRQIHRAVPHRHWLAAATAPQSLPKLDVFPTPTPLTRQERALAAYVAHTPQPEQQALAQAEHQETPLTVPPVKILPVKTLPLDALSEVTVLPVEALHEIANTN